MSLVCYNHEEVGGIKPPYILDPALTEIITPRHSTVYLDFFLSRVQAGFPSPADNYVERTLDLNELLIEHPSTTFFVRVSGDSMIGAGIHHGDILVVDRSLQAKDGGIIIATLNGEMTVKRLKIRNDTLILMPENPNYPELIVTEGMDFCIWGVVTSVIHQFNK